MIVDTLDSCKFYEGLIPHLDVSFAFLNKDEIAQLEPGKYTILGEEVFALVSEYETKKDEVQIFEAHKAYIDLHYINHGMETIKFAPIAGHVVSRDYEAEGDYALYQQGESYNQITLNAGMFAIFFPWDLHLPGIADKPSKVRKVVVKIRMPEIKVCK